MRAVGNKLIVEQDPPKYTRGIIHVPDGCEEYPNLGTILAVGPEVQENLKVGDRIVFRRKPSTAVDSDARPGDQYYGILVLPEDHILAVVEDEGTVVS